MPYKQKLSKIGNSIGLTIPKSIRDQLGFKIEQEVYIQEDLKNKNIIISAKPITEKTQVTPEFYELVKAISAKYSIALQELANK